MLTVAAALAALSAMTGAEAGVRVRESDANLDIARRVASTLREAGVTVSLTRTADRTRRPSSRTAPANRRRVDAFVSIHNNANRSRRVSGTEIYRSIRDDGSKGLGTLIWRGFRDEFGRERRNLVRTRRGCCGDYFYQLRNTRMASVLVEAAYVSNPAEGRALGSSPAYRQRLADAISRGILVWQSRLAGTAPNLDPGLTVPAPLPPPLDLSARAARGHRVVLRWRAGALAEGYRIYRDGRLIGVRRAPTTALDDVGGSVMRFIDRWATPGSSFSYMVVPITEPVGDVAVTGEGAPAIATVETPAIRVMLDPGHGGRDPGAVRRW